jgi:hypothetical protein
LGLVFDSSSRTLKRHLICDIAAGVAPHELTRKILFELLGRETVVCHSTTLVGRIADLINDSRGEWVDRSGRQMLRYFGEHLRQAAVMGLDLSPDNAHLRQSVKDADRLIANMTQMM